MKDMFDCLEEDWYENYGKHKYYIIKRIRNKKYKRFLFLSKIDWENNRLLWNSKKRYALQITPSHVYEYDLIRKMIIQGNIRCEFYYYHGLQIVKPVRKEKWWDRIKVWFSRKVQYFAGYISIEMQ
jgi:hypothetical protein